MSTARQLLDAVLFSNEHLLHLQALAMASLQPVPPDGQDAEHAPAANAEKPEDNGKAAQKASRQSKYAALLPEVRLVTRRNANLQAMKLTIVQCNNPVCLVFGSSLVCEACVAYV